MISPSTIWPTTRPAPPPRACTGRCDGARGRGAGRRRRLRCACVAGPFRWWPAAPAGPAVRAAGLSATRRRRRSPRLAAVVCPAEGEQEVYFNVRFFERLRPSDALHADPRHAGLRDVARRPARAAGASQPPARRRPPRQVQRPGRQAGAATRTSSPACAARSARRAAWSATELVLRGTVTWPGFGKGGEDWFGFVFRVDRFTRRAVGARTPTGRWSGSRWTRVLELPLWEGDRHFLPLVFARRAGSSTASCPTATAAGRLDVQRAVRGSD